MGELQVTAHLHIHEGKLDQFRAAAAACMESVRENDTGTLQYDWFFSQDQTTCLVRERYQDSAALIDHIGNLGDRLGALLETCDIEIDLFGDPSPELVDAVAALPTTVYPFFQGI